MLLQIRINSEDPKLQDVRQLIFNFDQNTMQIHLNNEAQDYIERELNTTGFPATSIQIVVTEQS